MTHLAESIIPAVAAAQSVDDKNRILCECIYNHFASKYGVMDKAKHSKRSKQPKPRSHNQLLKKLKRMRNEARRDLRRARRESQEEIVIQEIAKQFYKLIRMHSKAQKVSLRSRANLEARKARSECAKSLWRFAAKILDDDRPTNTTPAFSSQTAESFFKNVYSSAPKAFQHPEWLPDPPAPTYEFDDELIGYSI